MLMKTNAKDIAEYVAGLWFALIFATNTMVLLNIINIMPLNYLPSKLYAIIVLAPFYLIAYFLFIKDKRYKIIADKYLGESSNRKKRDNSILTVYIIATFASLVIF